MKTLLLATVFLSPTFALAQATTSATTTLTAPAPSATSTPATSTATTTPSPLAPIQPEPQPISPLIPELPSLPFIETPDPESAAPAPTPAQGSAPQASFASNFTPAASLYARDTRLTPGQTLMLIGFAALLAGIGYLLIEQERVRALLSRIGLAPTS